MRSLIDILELTTEEIDQLVALATKIIADPAAYAHKCDGKILATLFFEPSTRTRLSFESAMLGLAFVLSPPIEANVDPHFDKFMESGIRHVYTLFENKSVESSEQFFFHF